MASFRSFRQSRRGRLKIRGEQSELPQLREPDKSKSEETVEVVNLDGRVLTPTPYHLSKVMS